MKTFFPRRSLRLKLRIVILASTLVALLVALGGMIAYELRTYHTGWISALRAQAELIGRSVAPALDFDDHRMAHENLAMLRAQPKVLGAAVYEANGTPFAHYRAAKEAAQLPPAAPPLGVDRVLGEGRNLAIWHPVRHQGEIVGTVYLRAKDELYERIVNYAVIALGVTLLALTATWFLSSWLQNIVSGPILAISRVARGVVQHRDYSQRAKKLSDDEVGGLVDAFNGMLDEIERRTQELEASNQDKDREVEERRHAQQEVMRLNEELERRVVERTAQLELLNRDLRLATEAAESANRAKSEFLSGMSHELRTPLNAIIGFGQLLATTEPPLASAERQRGFVKHIVDAGEHLLTLINEILNLSQIEAGKVSLSLKSIELSDVLQECFALTQTACTQNDIKLIFPLETTLRVTADRTRLKQVLLNLLSNAVKYNRPQGSVTVGAALSDDGRVLISVRDTGTGLEPHQLRSLFQPFNRLGRENTAIEGTGIGLVLTKRLVELMGGEIGVDSTPGVGSTFWIELRGAETPSSLRNLDIDAVRRMREAPTDESSAPVTILCVDDNRANLDLLTEALSMRDDFHVITAHNGATGVEMARSYRPDVILLDNNMPVMSGREAMRALRLDPATALIPVIAVSADAMPETVAADLRQGYFRYLIKPFNLGDLMDAVDAALSLSRSGTVH